MEYVISVVCFRMSHPLIDIQHLTWQYPREEQLIFDNFSLKLHQGEFCFLTGKS